MRQHHAFGIAGRPRRIDERRQVIRLRGQRFLFPVAMFRRGGSTLGLDGLEGDDAASWALRPPPPVAPPSNTMTCLRPGRVAFPSRILSSCAVVEQNTATASESRRMYSVCFAVSVG